MQIGRLTVSNTEIIIPKFTFGKDTCILWEQVQYIKKSKGVSIWYKSNGRTKVKPVGELHKKDLQKLVGFWNSHLTEQVKQNGCLTGTLINDLSSFVMIAVSIVFCSLALLFVYLILKNDTLNPISCLMIYYILLFLLLPAIIIAYAWLSEYKKVKKWHSWKIDKTGFYRLTNYNHLIKTEIQKGDTVTYD
ncbi:MAG: hypothetical protein GY730_05340, partial [bacterium]|nr:hypothetical protein [bacterium]